MSRAKVSFIPRFIIIILGLVNLFSLIKRKKRNGDRPSLWIGGPG